MGMSLQKYPAVGAGRVREDGGRLQGSVEGLWRMRMRIMAMTMTKIAETRVTMLHF
jgi:hypothetical protein